MSVMATRPESTKISLGRRLRAHAAARWPQVGELEFRSQYRVSISSRRFLPRLAISTPTSTRGVLRQVLEPKRPPGVKVPEALTA